MAQFLISTTGVVTLADLGNRILPSGLNSVDIGTEFAIEELRYSADLASAIQAGTLSVVDDGRGRSISGPVSNAVATAFVQDIYHYDDTDVTQVIGLTTIDQLSGVTLMSPILNGQALVYNSGTGEWENGTISGSGAVDSVNSQTGVVVLDADDISDASTTNKFVTAADITKLSNLSGTNTGDQTSIVGITGTKAQFDTAVTDGNFLYVGDAVTTIAAGSANYLSILGGELSVTALAITTVGVDVSETSFDNWITNNYLGSPLPYQEGDVIILTAITAGTESYIHNGGVAGTSADWTLIQQPNVDQTTVRSWFSGTAPISYSSGTGAFSLALKANGGLVIESNELALDLGATAITGTLAVADGGTGTGTYAQGDILYADDANSLSRLAAGTTKQVLTMGATVPEWSTLPATKKTWSWGASSSASNTTNRYLDRHDGVPTNQSPYVAWYACELRAISFATAVASTWTAEVYVNGSSVATLASGGTQYGQSTGLSVSIAAGDRVAFYVNGTGVDRPSIDALFEEV